MYEHVTNFPNQRALRLFALLCQLAMRTIKESGTKFLIALISRIV